MKIDIHVHTKKTKKGDALTREIDAQRFYEIISSTEVKIVAITNHNVFDLAQYEEFVSIAENEFQIWPGVELDIFESDRRGHLLVIVAPEKAQRLQDAVLVSTKGFTPDNFNISIDSVIKNFDDLNPLYIAHYKQKKPDLIDEDIEKIISQTKHKNRVLKEATNAISAGIFLSHGHSSIYGSDVQNWNNYQTKHSNHLPDLRLPVESFEQFCLLLNKDNTAINTLLDKKYPEALTVTPFRGDPPIKLTVYDDINVFFGSKGTGKSDILKAIEKHYSSKGMTAKVFESGSTKISDVYDLGGKKIQIDLKDLDIEYCVKEIDFIRKCEEVNITSTAKYKQYFSESITNKNAKRISIKDFKKEDALESLRELNGINKINEKFNEFIEYLETDKSVISSIEPDKLKNLTESINSILVDLKKSKEDKFFSHKIANLFNSFIDKFNSEISRKTGSPEKPSGTGFREYALNRISIEVAITKIVANIEKTIEPTKEYVGSLDEKGDLYCKTEIRIQDGGIHDGGFCTLKSINKTPQKEFSNKIKIIKSSLYSDALFEKVSDFNSIDGIETIPSILELLVFKKIFTIDDEQYEPSTGESSMILLHRELSEDKEVYILDEPEKSLGNEYINNVIVPLIKEKAKLGKRIFIATHDANIAVRTLPYNSIYRYHSKSGYETYVGNPFSDNLINVDNQNDEKNWKEISMKTLEGGRAAFGERGQIYGNV